MIVYHNHTTAQPCNATRCPVAYAKSVAPYPEAVVAAYAPGACLPPLFVDEPDVRDLLREPRD